MGELTNLPRKSQCWAPWPSLHMFIPSTSLPSPLFLAVPQRGRETKDVWPSSPALTQGLSGRCGPPPEHPISAQSASEPGRRARSRAPAAQGDRGAQSRPHSHFQQDTSSYTYSRICRCGNSHRTWGLDRSFLRP